MQSSRLDPATAPPVGPTEDPAALRAVVTRLVAPRHLGLSVRSHSTSVLNDLVCDRYVFDHERRQGIEAVLLAPPGADRRAAILVSPGRKADLAQVAGLASPDYPDRNMAERLARAGFVTLTLDYGLDSGADIGTGMSSPDPAATLHQFLSLSGGSLVGALAEDALAALRWLAVHPRVDSTRLGLFGHSLGAAVSLHAALVTEQPLPLCAASHLGSYTTLYGRLCTGPEGGALPGILRHADLPQLYAALAPAPLQLQFGLDDLYLDASDAMAAGAAVEAAYAACDEQADAKEQAEVLALPMGHGTDVDEAVRFFGRALAAPTPSRTDVPAGGVVFDVASRIEIADRVDAALASGSLTLGRFGRQLEELAEPWTGAPSVAVASGSAGLEIALRIVGVAERTVLVPANTFFATAASAIRAGAHVDFVDMELDGLGMDPESLRDRLDRHDDVAAVVPVHIAGVVAPAVDEVLAECTRRGIAVVEDAAHALGSSLSGRPAGALGRMGVFSLYPTKVATSGEGGLLTCVRPEDAEQARCYRDQGKTSFGANVHTVLGSNWRMSELHAAVGIAHMERLGDIVEERRALAARYDECLNDIRGLRIYRPPTGTRSNYYKYVVLLDEKADREQLRRRLRMRHGISLSGGVYDAPLPHQPYFADSQTRSQCPRAEWFASHHVCLPLFNGMTERQQRAVIDALRAELV